jgi:hypothetical protein
VRQKNRSTLSIPAVVARLSPAGRAWAEAARARNPYLKESFTCNTCC